MTILAIVLLITGAFGWGGGGFAVSGSSLPKDKRTFKKCSNELVDALKIVAGKTVEELPAIAGSIVGAVLSFCGKVVWFAV